MENNDFHTPVLLIVFNRVETVKKVLDVIRQIKPPRFYVAADGPRKTVPIDVEKTNIVRDHIRTNIDWKCELRTLFSEANLGCKNGPAKAIQWFFSNEEQGIVLEDDCLPDLSFFPYCQELLERYKYDSRIGLISAFNSHPDYPAQYSYHLATGGSTWGWASWQRVGKHFNPDNEILKNPMLKNYLINATTDPKETAHICRALKKMQSNNDQIWDFSWGTLLKINSQLGIVPAVNLLRNIGADVEATHPLNSKDPLIKIHVGQMNFPLKHPPCIVADRKFSKLIAAQHVEPLWHRILVNMPLLPQVYRILFKPLKTKLKQTFAK